MLCIIYRFSQRNKLDVANWENKHQAWIGLWNQRDQLVKTDNRPHNERLYEKHLGCLAKRCQLKLKPGWTRENCTKLVEDDPNEGEDSYVAAFNMGVRDKLWDST